MPKSKSVTTTDVEEVVKASFDSLFYKITQSIDRLYDKNNQDMREIKEYLVEIKTELRMIRMLYAFWAEQNLSPEFMEKFAKEFDTIETTITKRVD